MFEEYGIPRRCHLIISLDFGRAGIFFQVPSIIKKRGNDDDSRHENYEILNLIGYGLAKFDMDFIKEFGFSTKTAFYENMASKGPADTVAQ